MSQKIVSVNIIGTNNKIINKNGLPILFYCDENSDVEQAIFQDDTFIEYLNKNLFTVENYSDAKIAYCFYNEVNGSDEYGYNIKEVEDWMTFENLTKSLDEEYTKIIVNKLYRTVFGYDYVWTMNFAVDLEVIYKEILQRYPDRFSYTSLVQYVYKGLKEFDLKQHNIDYIINKLNKIKTWQ